MENGTTILLVEDESNDVLLFKRAFSKCAGAISLQVVSNGDEAIAYLEGAGQYADRLVYPLPSLVILDIKLPRRSGFEILRRRLEDGVLKRIPALVLSSSTQQKDINLAYDLGANAYMAKPVSFTALEHLVQRVIEYWTLLCARPELQA